jgi:threonylcarbamoyladenosine tRNA methylthiotransferase MtaB
MKDTPTQDRLSPESAISHNPKVRTVTLGCKVNQYETQFLYEGLLKIGYQDAPVAEPADLCIVNTCTITSEGDSKSRQIIRRLHRDNPEAKIVVMGCYATREPDEVASLPGVSEVITDKRELPDWLQRFGVIDIPTGISGLSHRHRAYIKVQDGCLLRCSYCIIPTVRPNMFSRPLDEILEESIRLRDQGFREIVLTGIHLGHYGVDFNRGKAKAEWLRLANLVRAICRRLPELRVRLSSIEATEVTAELLEVMGEFDQQVCPHLHVCLQSGSDRILRAMKRRWTRRHIIDRCQLVAEKLHLPAFTTDVIVGFPGETAQDFSETLDACRQIGFSKIHIFPFSARRGTPAATMENQISKSVKAERSEELSRLEVQLQQQYFQRLVGQELQLLVERIEGGWAMGTSCRYAQLRIPLPVAGDVENGDAVSPSDLLISENELYRIRVTESQGNHLIGQCLQPIGKLH